MLDSRQLYATLPGLTGPWAIDGVEMQEKAGEVHVWVPLPQGECWVCPDCLSALQQTLGHSTIVVTQRYARLGDDLVKAEANRVYRSQS